MTQPRRLFRALVMAAAAGLILQIAPAAQGGKPPQNTMGAVGITVFIEANFHGANANFTAEVPDLRSSE